MPNPTDPDQIIEEDIGGVQGAEEEAEAVEPASGGNGATNVVAPDAGEIEWAGGLVKKAPRSE